MASAATAPVVFGWQEKSVIEPERSTVDMELDPTSATSSLTVQDLATFQKGGEDWVRFSIQGTGTLTGSGAVTLERQVLRKEKSKNSFSSSQRQVVRLSLCIGDKVYAEDLLLKTHGKGTSPIKLGRDVIAHLGLVDASRTEQVKPDCKG
ncbi:putative ATP-dependent zinc protease [Pseudomonas sp. RIT-To-2]|uniref:putative ATP-dependent zinc protease n=1 Tax=Pseudomonas sp. RIT-To-2 TaxID=3462541 RepID=UPI0024132A6E